MKSIGGLLFFFGLGSMVLHFMQREFVLLSWISNWGDTAAWVIRGAMVVVGGALWLMGNKSEGAAKT